MVWIARQITIPLQMRLRGKPNKKKSLTFQQRFVGDLAPKVARVEGHVAEVGQGGGQLDEEVTGQTSHHLDNPEK